MDKRGTANQVRRLSQRAAIYVRAEADHESRSSDMRVEAQLQSCRDFAQTLGADVVLQLMEGDASGKTLDRRDMTRLRQSVRIRAVDMVIVMRLDRLSDRLTDVLVLWEEFEQAGVELYMVRPVKLEAGESLATLLASIKFVIAKLERALFEE